MVELGYLGLESTAYLGLHVGCAFHPRCAYAIAECSREVPAFVNLGTKQEAACIRLKEINAIG